MSDSEDSMACENWLVNVEWIQGFLKKYHQQTENFVIKNHKVEINSNPNGVSNLSEVLATKIDYEYQGKYNHLDLYVKLLPNDPFSRYFVTEAQFDLREIKFYTQILPDLLSFQREHLIPLAEPMKILVPKCYHSIYSSGSQSDYIGENPEPPESILVLEDMRPFGYNPAHFTVGLNLLEAKSAIKTISVIHALSLAMKIKEKFLFQISKATESYQQLIEQGFPQLLKFLEEKGNRYDELKVLQNIKNRSKNIIELLLEPKEPIGLLTHFDFWCNNLLFKDPVDLSKEDNCVILDWQMVTYSRPTNDIALLLISSLSSHVRRENTTNLLDFYYDCLKDNLHSVGIELESKLKYTRDNLIDDYKKSQFLALLLCIGSVDIAIGNENAEQRFLDALEDLFKEETLCLQLLNEN